jgi:hypothetical protein
MTIDPGPGVKLRVLAIAFLIVFAVTVTGGYATVAILTDGETVEMTFDLAGNVGNMGGNLAGNAGNIDASMTGPGKDSAPTEDRPAVAIPPSSEVLAPTAKHGPTT